jgi:dihydroxyacid dehydratase/phosphogluconate dehydratase
MSFKKVEGHIGYVKDENGVVLNVNNDEIEAARKRKQLMREKDKEINELKDDVSDIKKMLTQIVEKLNG